MARTAKEIYSEMQMTQDCYRRMRITYDTWVADINALWEEAEENQCVAEIDRLIREAYENMKD